MEYGSDRTTFSPISHIPIPVCLKCQYINKCRLIEVSPGPQKRFYLFFLSLFFIKNNFFLQSCFSKFKCSKFCSTNYRSQLNWIRDHVTKMFKKCTSYRQINVRVYTDQDLFIRCWYWRRRSQSSFCVKSKSKNWSSVQGTQRKRMEMVRFSKIIFYLRIVFHNCCWNY